MILQMMKLLKLIFTPSLQLSQMIYLSSMEITRFRKTKTILFVWAVSMISWMHVPKVNKARIVAMWITQHNFLRKEVLVMTHNKKRLTIRRVSVSAHSTVMAA